MYRNDFNYNYAKTFGLFNGSSLIFGKCCYYKYNLKKKRERYFDTINKFYDFSSDK